MDHFKRDNRPEQAQGTNSPAFQRERYETIVRETIREIYGNARYWEFFNSFNEESIHDFITEYATKKAWYLINGERALANKTSEQFKFRDLAEKCFWEIQQKKLFNWQIEWRARLIEIDGIEVTRDFLSWEHAITRCRFIEPVNRGDLELYLNYLDSGKFSEKGWLYNWQDYDAFNNFALPAEVTPAWYQYYDEKRGTAYLKLLPDKRGEEERRYLRAFKESAQSTKSEFYFEDDVVSGPGPNLYMNYESLDFFIKTFEDKTIQRYFTGLETKPQDSILEAELQEALRILNKAHEPVSLEESADWRQAVIQGARKFKIKQIKSNLAVIYDEYKFRLQAGIEFNTISDNPEYDEYVHYANTYKQQIQTGKKLLSS
jgi:hypothetical protein